MISADEKTSFQARHRKAVGVGPMPHQPRLLEFEYDRMGAWAYVAAWDVHRAKLLGICEKTTGIEPYHKLVDLVMQQEPYRSARRVFWITDNGSSMKFQVLYNQIAKPFKWNYTKDDLKKTLEKIQAQADTINQLRRAA